MSLPTLFVCDVVAAGPYCLYLHCNRYRIPSYHTQDLFQRTPFTTLLLVLQLSTRSISHLSRCLSFPARR